MPYSRISVKKTSDKGRLPEAQTTEDTESTEKAKEILSSVSEVMFSFLTWETVQEWHFSLY